MRGRRYDVLGDAIRYLVTMPDSDKLAGAAYAKARPRKGVAVVARSRGPHGVTISLARFYARTPAALRSATPSHSTL